MKMMIFIQALDKFKAVNLMSLPVVNNENHLVGTLALWGGIWFKVQLIQEILGNTMSDKL